MDRPCLDRVQNRSKQDRVGRRVQAESTTENGVNQEARFPKNKRLTSKQIVQTLLKNWQRKSDARSCNDRLLPGHIAANCTADKWQAAATRVILGRLATTHEAVLPKHDARSAVRAWYRKNGVDFGQHDANVLSLMTTAVNKAGLAVFKAERYAVKLAVGRKTNPVSAVSSDNDSTSESSSSSSCYIYFSFKRVAEEATIVYADLQKTSGETHRCLHSMLDLSNPHVLAGAEWWTEEYKPRLLACGWDPIKKHVDHERHWRWSTIYSLVCGECCSVSTSASRRINYVVLL
jgi:hypothetical protein